MAFSIPITNPFIYIYIYIYIYRGQTVCLNLQGKQIVYSCCQTQQ